MGQKIEIDGRNVLVTEKMSYVCVQWADLPDLVTRALQAWPQKGGLPLVELVKKLKPELRAALQAALDELEPAPAPAPPVVVPAPEPKA